MFHIHNAYCRSCGILVTQGNSRAIIIVLIHDKFAKKIRCGAAGWIAHFLTDIGAAAKFL